MRLAFKNILFSIFVPGVVAILIPHILTGWKLFHEVLAAGGWALTGWPVLVAGGLLYCHCVWNFAFWGRGTPLPIDAPQRLVIKGAYRFTRNPMYVSVLMVISGFSILSMNLIIGLYAIVVFILFHSMVVFYEEPTLRKIFGSEYESYSREVPRWLFCFYS